MTEFNTNLTQRNQQQQMSSSSDSATTGNVSQPIASPSNTPVSLIGEPHTQISRDQIPVASLAVSNLNVPLMVSLVKANNYTEALKVITTTSDLNNLSETELVGIAREAVKQQNNNVIKLIANATLLNGEMALITLLKNDIIKQDEKSQNEILSANFFLVV